MKTVRRKDSVSKYGSVKREIIRARGTLELALTKGDISEFMLKADTLPKWKCKVWNMVARSAPLLVDKDTFNLSDIGDVAGLENLKFRYKVSSKYFSTKPYVFCILQDGENRHVGYLKVSNGEVKVCGTGK